MEEKGPMSRHRWNLIRWNVFRYSVVKRIFIDYNPKGQTITDQYYGDLFDKLAVSGKVKKKSVCFSIALVWVMLLQWLISANFDTKYWATDFMYLRCGIQLSFFP